MFFSVIFSLALRSPSARHRTRTRPLMQVGMTGGDLEGGGDAKRNAEVAQLKNLFYQETAAPEADAGDQRAGLLRNVTLRISTRVTALVPSRPRSPPCLRRTSTTGADRSLSHGSAAAPAGRL